MFFCISFLFSLLRRSWCTNSDGLLLKFVMDVLHEEMSKDRSKISTVFREEINQAFEQCSFCLYGHPNKKSRVKHLQDHGCSQVKLPQVQFSSALSPRMVTLSACMVTLAMSQAPAGSWLLSGKFTPSSTLSVCMVTLVTDKCLHYHGCSQVNLPQAVLFLPAWLL